MVIDFHTHVIQPDVRNDRKRYFDGEPEFKLLYESPKATLSGATEMVDMMDEEGVDKAVIFGFPWRSPDLIRHNNDYVMDAVELFSDRLIGFCCVNPAHENAADEVARCLESGCSGVGELAFYDKGIDDAALKLLDPIMALCREKDRIVLIHTNEPVGHAYPGKAPMTLTQIYTMVKRFAENRIVLAHWGGGIFLYHLLKKEVRECLKNVWFDTAASPFLYDPKVYHVAKELLGVEKILFGTDYTLMKPSRYFKEMKSGGLSEAEITAVCGGNAEKLLAGE